MIRRDRTTLMSIFLGIDGGGSQTTCAVGDETSLLGSGAGAGSNVVRVGEDQARKSIASAIRQACSAAKVTPKQIKRTCIGIAGGARPENTEIVRRILSELVSGEIEVVGDMVIAMEAASGSGSGVVVIAGTGSIAYGRNAEGQTARAGGWGFAFGDEGGAFDLVRQAVRAGLRQEEGWGPATALRLALLKATGASSMNDLVHRFYTSEYPRTRIASFAKLVDEAARNGDPVARDILHVGAQALATFVAAVRRQLFHRSEHTRVSYIGGAFESAMLRERFAMLVTLECSCRLEPPAYGPAAGALIEAYRMVGLRVHPLDAPHSV